MDTLRYVQQFGRSKRDNLKPSLLSKYHVGSTIEVYPFRIMDFGCFASTTDGLSGLIHNSEMSSMLQSSLPEMIEKQVPLTVRINKFDRRTGEIAFSLEKKETVAVKSAEETTAAPAAPAQEEAVAATSEAAASAVAVVAAPVSEEPVQETAETDNSELTPYQFKINRPILPEAPEPRQIANDLSARLDQETEDIQKFLEGVLKQNFSPKATKMLRELLQESNTFRFTYAMQTVVDDFEPDVSVQLLTLIERALRQQKK